MSEKKRYTDEELAEFKAIILYKLKKAQEEYDELRSYVNNSDGNDVKDTSPTFKTLEEVHLPCQKNRQDIWHNVKCSSFNICKLLWYVLKTKLTVFAALRAN